MGLQKGQTAFPQNTHIFSAAQAYTFISVLQSFSSTQIFILRRVRHNKRCKWSHCTCRDISSGFLGKTKYPTRHNNGWAKTLSVVQVFYFQNTVSTDSSLKENLSKDVNDRLTQNFCLVAMRNLTFYLSSEVNFQIKLKREDHKSVVNLIMGCHSQLTTFAIKQKSVVFFCS